MGYSWYKLDSLSYIETREINVNGIILYLTKIGRIVTGSIDCSSPDISSTYDTVIVVQDVLPIGWEPISRVLGYGSSAANNSVARIEIYLDPGLNSLRYKYSGGSFAYCSFAYCINR